MTAGKIAASTFGLLAMTFLMGSCLIWIPDYDIRGLAGIRDKDVWVPA